MKCIKAKVDDTVTRVSDEEAFEKVESGKYHYVPKNVYRTQQRKGK